MCNQHARMCAVRHIRKHKRQLSVSLALSLALSLSRARTRYDPPHGIPSSTVGHCAVKDDFATRRDREQSTNAGCSLPSRVHPRDGVVSRGSKSFAVASAVCANIAAASKQPRVHGWQQRVLSASAARVSLWRKRRACGCGSLSARARLAAPLLAPRPRKSVVRTCLPLGKSRVPVGVLSCSLQRQRP